jgi:hypothetical protein
MEILPIIVRLNISSCAMVKTCLCFPTKGDGFPVLRLRPLRFRSASDRARPLGYQWQWRLFSYWLFGHLAPMAGRQQPDSLSWVACIYIYVKNATNIYIYTTCFYSFQKYIHWDLQHIYVFTNTALYILTKKIYLHTTYIYIQCICIYIYIQHQYKYSIYLHTT